jgi:tetratricopeptide (TPR) repeat protein
MIEAGEAAEAGAQLDRAEQLLGDRAEPVDRVLLHTQKARRALKLGDPRTALVEAKASLDLAGQLFPHERGSALLTLAQALAGVHDRDAEDAFATAATHIDELGPKRLRAEAYRSWARLLRDAGRETEALDVLERATDPELVER